MTASHTDEELLFDYAEAARRLRVKQSWLETQVQHRRVPCRRLGRLVWFSVADLEEIVASARHAPVLTEAARPANDGHPLYPRGLVNLLGVQVAQVPNMGTDALVLDASRCLLVVSRDFRVTASDQYAPGFKADKTALRVTGRFACAIPLPNAAIRKLAITP